MSKDSNSSASSGIGCLGSLVAVFLSIKSFGFTWWALLHFILGWIYVAYWIVFNSGWIK